MHLIDIPFNCVAMDLIVPIVPAFMRGHLHFDDHRVCDAIPRPLRYARETLWQSLRHCLQCGPIWGFPKKCCPATEHNLLAMWWRKYIICYLYAIITTTPYYPQGNRMCERFNGTLKTLIKKLCHGHPQDWDRYLPVLLSAYYRDITV